MTLPGSANLTAARLATIAAPAASRREAALQPSGGRPARVPEKTEAADRRDARGAENGPRGRQASDALVTDALAQANLRLAARGDLEEAAGMFASQYMDEGGQAAFAGDDGSSGGSDGADAGAGAGAAPAQAHLRPDAAPPPGARGSPPLAAFLATEVVAMLSVIDKDRNGRRAVRMDLKHAALPRTSVTLENLPDRLMVVFECGEPRAIEVLGKETPRLAADLALRRRRDCSVLVNTAPPGSQTRHRADAESPEAMRATAHRTV